MIEPAKTVVRRHAIAMRALAKDMAAYTDEQLQVLAAKPQERAQMEEVLCTALAALIKGQSLGARRARAIQVRRLRYALNNPGILA